MKQIIFLSLFVLANNEGVLAYLGIGRKKKLGPTLPPIPTKDPRFVPQKYCVTNKCTPTVRPAPSLNAEKEAKTMHDVLDDMGSPSVLTLIQTMTKYNSVQRQEIAQAFQTKYRKAMIRAVRGESHGVFRAVLSAQLTPLPAYLAKELHNNMVRKGTDEMMLVEHMCSISNFGIKSIGEFYKKEYGKPFADEVKGETTGTFQKVMVSIAQGKRDPDKRADNRKAAADARALLKSKGNWKANDSKFSKVFATRSYTQLRQTLIEYRKIAGHDIDEDIKKEFQGKEAKGLMEFAKCSRSKDDYIAERLHHSMKGFGTKEATLTRIITSRSEIDLGDIKAAYKKKYKKSLEGWVADDISGDYKDIMLSLIKGAK